ncbi:MAG: insulinase family protein [bacterium]
MGLKALEDDRFVGAGGMHAHASTRLTSMRGVVRAWSCAVLFVLPATSALAQGAGIEARTLRNGLLVLVIHNASAEKFEVSTGVFAGSRDEPATLRGLTHLSEHIAMRETRSGTSIAETAAANDIAMTAVTLGDLTRFTSSANPTAKALQTVLELERRRLGDVIVTPSTVAAEIQRIRTETSGRLGDQHDGNALFGTHRLARASSHVDLARITDDDVRAFIRRYYVPGNATVVISSSLPTNDVLVMAERVLGVVPAGKPIARPIFRDSTRIASTGRRGPVAGGGGYGLAVTIPGLQHPARPAIERDLAVLRMRLVAAGPESAVVTISDQSPASVLSIRTPSSAVLDSVFALLDARPTIGQRDAQPATPDLLQCEAAGDWRYCLVIAAARASPANNERLDALGTFLRGSQTPLPLWP